VNSSYSRKLFRVSLVLLHVVEAVVGEVGAIPDPTLITKILGAAGEAVVEVVEGVGEVAVVAGAR